MSDGCPSSGELTRWLAGALAESDADAVRTHVESCTVCQAVLSKAAPAALFAHIAASEHIASVTLSEYADGGLGGARRQLVQSHIEQCPMCQARLARLQEDRMLCSQPAATVTNYPRRGVVRTLSRSWRDAAVTFAVALVVIGAWWLFGTSHPVNRDGVVTVALPPALLRELPAEKREVMRELCRNLTRTTGVAVTIQGNQYRGAKSLEPPVRIIYPLPMDVLPSRDLDILVRTPGDSTTMVEVFDKESGSAVGRWKVPSGSAMHLSEQLVHGRTYTIVSYLQNDPGLRSEDRLFSTAPEPLAKTVRRLSELCRGDSLLLGALYEIYGMYGAADRYYADAVESMGQTTRGRDVYQAWRIRSGLERQR